MGEDDDDKTYLGCLSKRMAAWTPGSVTEGSVLAPCSKCGTEVWLSVSGQALVRDRPGAEAVCMSCMLKLRDRHDVSDIHVTPDAVAEAEAHLKKTRRSS